VHTTNNFFTGQPRRLLIIIIAASLLARVAATLYIGNEVYELPGTFDQISYHNLALRLINGFGFTFGERWWPMTAAGAPTAHWSYLYTLFLAGIYKLIGPIPLGARLLQVLVVGILQPYLVYLIGRHVFSAAVGLTAAALTAVYSYFVYYSATLMTEPFYITTILASLYLTIRLAEAKVGRGRCWLAIGLGLTLGTTILLRQLFVVFVPLLLLWLLWAGHRHSGRWPLSPAVMAGAIVVFMILPFTIYNYSRFDRFVLLNTNAGYAFYWANHPVYGTHYQPLIDDYVALVPDELRGLDEAALDQALLQRGVQIVLEDPLRYAQLSLSRIPVYFMFWPSPDSGIISNVARISSFGILWPFMLLGMFFAFVRGKSSAATTNQIALLFLFVIAYSLIHLLSWSLIRYRLPVDAILLVFAGLSMVVLFGRVNAHLAKRRSPMPAGK
jgi:4-amino-4-deoxy-L-arabinose transferase-like glycosyltransferase